MLEKIIQAIIITFLLNLTLGLSRGNSTNVGTGKPSQPLTEFARSFVPSGH